MLVPQGGNAFRGAGARQGGRYLALGVLATLLLGFAVQCRHRSPEAPSPFSEYLFLVHPRLGYQWVIPGGFAGVLEPNGFSFFRKEGEILLGNVWIAVVPVPERETTLLSLQELLSQKTFLLKSAVEGFAPQGVEAFLEGEERMGRDFYGDPVVTKEFSLKLLPAFRRDALAVLQWGARVLGNSEGKLSEIPPRKESQEFRILFSLGALHDYRGIWVPGQGGKGIVTSLWVGTPEGEEKPSRWEEIARPYARLQPLTTRFATSREVEERFNPPATVPSLALIVVGDSSGLIQGQELTRVKNGVALALNALAGKPVEVLTGFIKSCKDEFLNSSPGGSPWISTLSPNFTSQIQSALDLLWEGGSCPGNRLFWSAIRAYRNQGGSAWQGAKERWILWVSEGDDQSPCLSEILGNSCPNPDEFFSPLSQDGVHGFGVAYVSTPCSRTDASVSPANRASNLYQTMVRLGGRFFEYCEDWQEPLKNALMSQLETLVGNQLAHTPFPGTLRVYAGELLLFPDPVTGYLYREEDRTLTLGSALPSGTPFRVLYRTMLEPEVP